MYDITNVLEGIGLIGKCGKNNVRFMEGVQGAATAGALLLWLCCLLLCCRGEPGVLVGGSA